MEKRQINFIKYLIIQQLHQYFYYFTALSELMANRILVLFKGRGSTGGKANYENIL
jgi:hypothetical protein